jgi:threonine/homoserine/homoserine lactone efflux protein
MSIASLLIFCSALLFAAASPGPGIAAIVARVLGHGTGGAIALTMGLAFGDIVWLTLAVGGLAVLAQTFQLIFLIVKWAGVLYLLFLAWKMWTFPATVRAVAPDPRRENPFALFLGGLSVTMGNPKVMVFYLALLPTLLDLTRISYLGFIELVCSTLSVLSFVFGLYIVLAARARCLLASAGALRFANRASAAAMTGAAAWVATR